MSDSFATPWTAAQGVLSVGFPRQEYWSGLPFLSPGDLPQGSNPCPLLGTQILYQQVTWEAWDQHSFNHTIALISQVSKVILKILQAKLQQWTMKFQMFKLDLEKEEEPEIKLPTSVGSWKKQESSRKTYISALLTMPKPLTVWTTTNWKILK